jgi:hypothetical protein
MKNVIVSTVVGIAIGFAACYFLLDRNESIEENGRGTEQATPPSKQTDSTTDAVVAVQSADTSSGVNSKALRASMTEVRGYTQAYHSPVSAGGGGAPLFTNVRSSQCPLPNDIVTELRVPIKSFYLSKELVIDVLKDKFESEKPQDDYRGFAGLLGYDSKADKYNITWSLVYSEENRDVPENSCGDMIYFLPDVANESDPTYLYEHVYLCPPNCRANEDRFQ